LICFFVCLCLAEMNIIYLKNAAATTGAVCLDGTPAAYYFKAGSSINSTKWMIHIQGGGWCYSEEDCARRSETDIGSSAKMNVTVEYGGIMSENKTINPEFYDWNHVFMAYCDGASFAGDLADPIRVNGKLIYFRGYRNLKAIMNDLLHERGMNKATEVLLCGSSAGGLAVYLHADQIGEMLPGSVHRYKAIPFSGVFLDHPNAENIPVYTPQIQKVFSMQNCTAGVNVRCLVSKSPRYMHLCMMAEYTMQHTETPLFVMNSAYDSWSTECILGSEPVVEPTILNGNCSAVPGWYNCELNHSQCTQNQWAQIEQWGNDYSDRIENNAAVLADGNGIYEYSCHRHCAELGHWDTITVQGTVMRDALIKWYYSKNEPASKHTYKDCKNKGSFCCNPTCCPQTSN